MNLNSRICREKSTVKIRMKAKRGGKMNLKRQCLIIRRAPNGFCNLKSGEILKEKIRNSCREQICNERRASMK